jgi:hypothetical protein
MENDAVKETVVKGPDEKEQPKIQNETGLASEQAKKVAELVSCLDDYFEHDANLRKQYQEERPISDLHNLKLVQLQKPDEDTLLSAIKECKKLNLNATKDKVRANIGQGRTILILRDLPRDVQYDHVKKLMETEELTKLLESRVKEIRPELNDTWFVRFASQEDCMAAFFWLQQNGKLNGKKVKCRVKSVLQSSRYNPSNTAAAPASGNPYADRPFRGGYAGPGMYSAYGPGFGPMGAMQFPGHYQPYGRGKGHAGGRGRRGGNRRGRSSRGPQGNNYGDNSQATRQQSFRQKRQSPQITQQKSSRGDAGTKATPEVDDNIYYEGQFVMVERQSFDQIVKSCCNVDTSEPYKPKELLAFEGLMCDTPKKAFDLKPLSQGTTISPMPGAQPSPPEPEAMSLGEAKKGLENKMKEVKSFAGNKPAKEAKKKKTGKKANAVQESEDQKEEEVVLNDPAVIVATQI